MFINSPNTGLKNKICALINWYKNKHIIILKEFHKVRVVFLHYIWPLTFNLVTDHPEEPTLMLWVVGAFHSQQ